MPTNINSHSSAQLQALKELYGMEWEVPTKMHGPQTELESLLNPTSYELRNHNMYLSNLMYSKNPWLQLTKE